jgi:integrase
LTNLPTSHHHSTTAVAASAVGVPVKERGGSTELAGSAANLFERLLSREPIVGDTWTQRALGVARGAWAESTWASRAQLWQRLSKFRALHGTTNNVDVDIARFCEAQPVRIQARHQYAKTLATVAKYLEIPTPISKWYQTGLARLGALIAEDPAVPATKQQMEFIKQFFPPITAAVLLLCWKAAARFDDVQRLKRDNFLLVTPTRIIIQWGQTKSNQTGVLQSHSLTVVDDTQGMPIIMHRIMRLKNQVEFSPLNGDQVRNMLKKFPATRQLTLHSFKRGAADVLISEVSAGHLDIDLVPRLLKHKHEQEVPDVTLRYVSERIKLAIALRTQEATKLL